MMTETRRAVGKRNIADEKILLEARDLAKEFALEDGKKGKDMVHAVSGVNLKIYKGEALALVGESGYGRNILGRTLVRLSDTTSDTIEFDGMDIMGMKDKEFAGIRRQMQIIFQDPYALLNPRVDVKEIISESLTICGLTKNRAEVESQVQTLIDEVGIPREFINYYPHQLLGGQGQRIGIARATALHPRLTICNEPVSALDVSIQSQVLNLLKGLQEQYQLTYLSISHGLGMVKFISDRTCVTFLGMVCEVRDTHELYNHPPHPYTCFLLNAIPKADLRLRNNEQELLTGEIPSPVNPPSGCRFHTKCPYARGVCNQKAPEGTMVEERQMFCHFLLT